MKLLLGDCLGRMREIPDGSVALTVTSPPYDLLRTYDTSGAWGESKWQQTLSSLLRVTCAGGVVAWVVGDGVVNGSETGTSFKQALYALSIGFRLHDTMIYQKLNFSHPEKARYHSVFEYVFIFSKGAPRTFNPIKDKQNTTAGCIGNLGVNTFTERDGSKSVRPKKLTAEFGMRGNVWLGKTRGQEEMCKQLTHPAMMPKWLARDLIYSWSNEGDTVLDPFMGSGTTGVACAATGRDFIGIEQHAGYFAAAENSITEAQMNDPAFQ